MAKNKSMKKPKQVQKFNEEFSTEVGEQTNAASDNAARALDKAACNSNAKKNNK